MIQLVPFNTSTKGVIAECLSYVRRGFGAAGGQNYAWDSFLATKHKHYDRNFPQNVTVILWYEYWVGTHNQGHVTTYDSRVGLHSSPYSTFTNANYQQGTNTHALLPYIEEVERIYHCKYVAWSEDISNVKVVGAEMITKEQYDVAGHAASFQWGPDFNYDPNMPMDNFVNLLLGQAPKVTPEFEKQYAEDITGVKNVMGNDYNSLFVGKTIGSVEPEMRKFYLGYRPSGVKPDADGDKWRKLAKDLRETI